MSITFTSALTAGRMGRLVSARTISRSVLPLTVAALAALAVLPAAAGAADSGCTDGTGPLNACVRMDGRAQVVSSGVAWGTVPPASASPLPLSSPLAASVSPLARAARAWYAYRPTTFVASERRPGARLTGIVLALNSQSQPVLRCSGTVVNSPNGSVVWTAGHCVVNYRTHAAYAHFEFVPGAGAGPTLVQPAAPYGVWSAVAWATTKDWALHGSAHHMRRDFGALLLARNAQGRTISQVLGGSQHISFSGRIPKRAELLGYPGTGRFHGNDSLIGCGPRPVGRASVPPAPGPEPLGIACSMTEGSSGGPWLTHVNSRGIGTVVSVTSVDNVAGTALFGGVQNRAIRAVWDELARRAVP